VNLVLILESPQLKTHLCTAVETQHCHVSFKNNKKDHENAKKVGYETIQSRNNKPRSHVKTEEKEATSKSENACE